MIVGIDEVGRGCWAGPLCVGAVILSDDTDRTMLGDSKKLSAKKRLAATLHIKQTAAAIGVGWASARFIDQYGLSEALRHACRQAIEQITVPYDEIILDGTVNFLAPRNVTLLPRADALIPAVSAASIVAKVARDQYMQAIDGNFPGYGFATHVGYGTAVHRSALTTLGPTKLHRMSFAPLAQIEPIVADKKISLTSGFLAERRAAEFLLSSGYTILQQNWKTKWCEIDIIAQKDNIIHFVEVKYRRNQNAGTGVDYITRQKQRQMAFAAEMWQLQKKSKPQCCLSAIEVSGYDFAITKFIENIAGN